MKKKKIISLAAAGVVAATSITTSAFAASREEPVTLTEENAQLTDFEEQLLCGIYPYAETTPEKRAAAEESYKVGLLLEHGVIDSVHPDNTIVGEDGLTARDREIENAANGIKAPLLIEQYEEELDAILAAQSDVEIKLSKVFSDPYTLWSGRFIVQNYNEDKGYTFKEPKFFTIDIKRGKQVTMQSKNDYSGRFKSSVVYATYKNNSTGATKRVKVTKEGTGDLYLNPSAVSKSSLVELTCYFYVYEGDSINSEYEEAAVVHIVDQDYANSAQYVENSYANMIDQYVQIDN